MKDYTKELGFWERLKSFVSDVETGCCMGEEEKQMIMHNCELKISTLKNVNNRCSHCLYRKYTSKARHKHEINQCQISGDILTDVENNSCEHYKPIKNVC